MKFIKKLKNLFNINFRKDKILATKPLASREAYLKIFEIAKKKKISDIEKIFEYKKVRIDDNWFDDLALTTQIVIKKSDINYYHGKILYSYLSEYIKENNFKKILILETGTARGYSSVCMSKALIDLNVKGKIFTFDILPHNKKMYWNCIEDHNGKNTRKTLLSKWNKELKNIIFIEGKTKNIFKKIKFERINFAFLDAGHNYNDVMLEFNFVNKHQKKGDMIIFDDYSPNLFNSVVRAIEDIENLGTYKFEKILATNERGYAIAKKI